MPYTIRKQENKYCVYKKGTNKKIACHPTKQKAVDQIAAIEMNEKSFERAFNLVSYDSGKILLDDNTFDVYVATSEEQKKNGLSGLLSLDKDGMLFVYEEDSITPFHMNGMNFDLDIAWFDSEGELICVKTVSRFHAGPVKCDKPYRYVLEAPAGTLSNSEISRLHKRKKNGKKWQETN